MTYASRPRRPLGRSVGPHPRSAARWINIKAIVVAVLAAGPTRALAQVGDGGAAGPSLDIASVFLGLAIAAILAGVALVVFLWRSRKPVEPFGIQGNGILTSAPVAVVAWDRDRLVFLAGSPGELAATAEDAAPGAGSAPSNPAASTPGATMDLAGFLDLFRDADRVPLQRAIAALRGDGTPFRLDVRSRGNGRDFAAVGIRGEGRRKEDAIWLLPVAELAERLRKADQRVSALENVRDDMTALLDALPMPVWLRDADLRLTYANTAYGQGVDTGNGQAAVASQRELAAGVLGADGRDLAREVDRTRRVQEAEGHVIIGGSRRFLRFTEFSLLGGRMAGIAVDRTDIEDARTDLQRHTEAHAAVLRNLAIPIAMFGADGRMNFHNPAYAEVWRLDSEWLKAGPTYGEVLEALRELRKVPEYADFPAYKREQMKLFNSVLSTLQDELYLPDGTALRRVISPHPFGGLVFTYEDVTDTLAIERSYHTSVAVHRETLDNMHEGVAVYGSDGRLKLSNPSFEKIWSLDLSDGHSQLHVRDFVEQCAPLLRDDADDSGNFGTQMITDVTERRASSGKVERADGTVLDYAAVPLPDGNMLFSYIDVTDGIRVARALEERTKALEAADVLKSEFLANVSYELRTPLNAIIGFCEILENRYFGELNERQGEYTRGILDASYRLLTLIDDILDLASIEAGRFELEFTDVSIPDLLDSVAATTREWARKQGLEIELDCPRNVGEVVADEGRLKQVLFNLISNAIKFTPNGGRVTVSAARERDTMVLAVADTGIGIPEKAHKRVFESFVRLDPRSRRSGPGLGLALVKSVVETHGGSIEVDANQEAGARFVVRLPLDAKAATAIPERFLDYEPPKALSAE